MKVGDWVQIMGWPNDSGYVVEITGTIATIRTSLGGRHMRNINSIKPLDAKLHINNIHQMQLLAVDTNDEEWFDDLARMKDEAIKNNKNYIKLEGDIDHL